MSTNFSPSRSPGSTRFQLGGAPQRLRSSSLKKPPEPLRRAVADCLSSSSSHHVNLSPVASEATRTLRDYLAAPSTIDLAYSVILDHALAERERSPAVVARCVALLKRYLLRYVPSEQTLLQIDLFCVNSINECDPSTNRRVSPWSKSFTQHSVASATGNAFPPPLPASNFASGALVKSLNYVRSLVGRHLPIRSFQPAVFAGASTASKQSLPTLSSFLSRSFNSQLNPMAVSKRESPETKEASSLYSPDLSNLETVDGWEDSDYISVDAFRWRWLGEHQSSLVVAESDGITRPQDVTSHGFLEVGAAALLVGNMEVKMKTKHWTDTQDVPDLDQVLRPSTVTTATNVASAHSHLRAITASKRSKTGPHSIWEDTPVSTFRPRARPLFQYRHYSEQQPLRLNAAEVCEVIAAVCSETSLPNANPMTVSSRLSHNTGKPSMDVAVSVLIKLVIDMYVLDSWTAAPLTLSMLEDMLSSPILASKVRAFDLILNLGVHAHLLEPMLPEEPPTIEEECSQEAYIDNEGQLAAQAKKNIDSSKQGGTSSAIDNFESWLLSILFEVLLLLVQIEEKEETVWASALSCLFYFVCDRGKIRRKRLGLDIRVIKMLLEISREHSWAEAVHCKLICMLTNMFYEVPDASVKSVSSTPIFLVEQVDLLGGIEFICLEYSHANSMEEKRNLFLVLFDYVLYRINETCLATGGSEYSFDEIQPLAVMLSLANAPEAFYMAVKHGVEGIGEILRGSISAALSRYPNSERLNTILEKIIKKFDNILGTFTHLDDEFSHLLRITKSYKSLKSIKDGDTETGVGMNVKPPWATLHTLLHSKRSAYRQNGYIWLVELLVAEISEDRDTSVLSGIRNLQKQIGIAGSHDSTDSEVPLSIWVMCGLLKSKHSFIRWGFLFVLEKLLMRCKLLLGEKELEHSISSELHARDQGNHRLEKANAVIDIMSSSLLLVYQINETDHINILKMCDMLFSQLCLRLIPGNAMHIGNLRELGKVFGCTDGNGKQDGNPHVEINYCRDEFLEEINSKSGANANPSLICDSASLAAMLLRGQALVPMQLVARVPTALFYWPLIQLAGAATDDIALGVAVGSKGRGNLPGATSDIRAALLLLLIGKCTADPAAFLEVGGEEFFRELLDDTDSRVAYYSSAFLLKRMMTEEPEKYQRMLQSLVYRAQQSNNEKLLENPYLQMCGILKLSDLGSGI